MLRHRREALRDAAGRTRFVTLQCVYNREEIWTPPPPTAVNRT